MKKFIKVAIAASTFLTANTATISTVAASSINHTPKVSHVVKARNSQEENPLLRKYAQEAIPDGGGSRSGYWPDPDEGRVCHWW